MRFQEVTVTPQIAAEMLSHNTLNRKLNHKRVKAYAKDIENGKWTTAPSPISFSEKGDLLDGQHRLSAVVAANTPVNMVVAYDVPAESVIDRGLPRDSGSALYMRGLIDAAVSSRTYMAVVNRYLTAANGRLEIQDFERADFINANQDNLMSAVEISRTGSRNPLCKKAPIQAAFLAALMSGVPEETLISFANIVNTGFMSDPTQASAVVLRNYILENNLGGHSASEAMTACAQMAIRDFVEKDTRQSKYRRKYHVYINGRETVRGKQ